MLTTAKLSQQSVGILDKKISLKKGDKIYYSPELDSDGSVYYAPISEKEIITELAQEDKKGYKTYSVKEVRQKLRDDLGLQI